MSRRKDIDWDEVAARYTAGETYLELACDLETSQHTVRNNLKGRVQSRPPSARPGVTHNRAGRMTEGRGADPTARIARPSVSRMYR